MTRALLFSLCLAGGLAAHAASDADGWISLFDGRSLAGWRASENPVSFRVEDGAVVCDGPRAHLFYTGAVAQATFTDFEASADVFSEPKANSGFYFHTAFQPEGFPARGFEVQVCNTYEGHGDYKELKKTGSLYGVRNQYKTPARDREWFNLYVRVEGPRVQVRVNGLLTVDYLEPSNLPERARRLGRGTFALQCHDPASKVRYKNLRVRPLPAPSAPVERPVADEVWRHLLRLNQENFPIVDSHAHLKGGLTLDQLLAHSRASGIYYGVAVNCGVGFGVTNDAGIYAYLNEMAGQPVFLAMQAEGREWVNLFSPAAVAKFDYVFTDSMTFTDHRGRRTRLWIKNEVEVGDKQALMDLLVSKIEGIMDREPVDLYVNPTFLPDEIAAEYDALWTRERMERVVTALARNGVAMEINARYKLPSPAFIKLAKSRGVKFSLGTNNGDRDLGRLEYALQMIRECGLSGKDMFVPKPDGQKPVQVRGFKR